MSRNRESPGLGEAWEMRVVEFLSERGLTIITRRYRCRLGELDIVAHDAGQLVIVEVRARGRAGKALESIGPWKRRRIVNATRHFLMRHSHWHARPIRFDVVAVHAIDTSHPRFQWVKNAFDAT